MNPRLCSLLLSLSLPVQAGFVLQNGFSEFLHQQFLNLTQLKSQSGSLQKTLATQNAIRGLLGTIAPHIEALSDYKKPFASNCSVFFDTEIDQVACDAKSEDVQEVSGSCEPEQQFPNNYLTQLHKSNILQIHTVVGLGPLQHPQIAYWLYYKLPPTQTVSSSISSALNPTRSLPSIPTESQTDSFILTQSASTSQTGEISLSKTSSLSQSTSALHSDTLTQTDPVIWNPEWANWDVSTGVYQDATNQTGRYVETVPGVVTDTRTGLQWQKATAPGLYNWNNATDYCENLVLSGYADWRLPTLIELQTLVDYTINCAGPSLDIFFFPGTPASFFLTSTPLANSPGSAWYVSFGNGTHLGGEVCSQGYIGCSAVPTSGYVHCVRPSFAKQLIDRYRDEAGNLLNTASTQVKDLMTGLLWQRAAFENHTWSAAQIYCSALNLGGQSWRLPTIKELSTLLEMDVSLPGPTINITVFPSTIQYPYWSSTLYSCDTSDAWSVYFEFGGVNTYWITDSRGVRCVRSPVVYNPEWANWDQSMQVYQDATNQTGRYVEAREGVITDTSTGLQWEKEISSDTYNTTAAKAYCDDLFKNGFGDWRLPTREELQSIVDYTVTSGVAIDSTAFPNTPANGFWSSTLFAKQPNLFQHFIRFTDGISTYGNLADLYSTRCVRPLSVTIASNRYTDEAGNTLTPGSMQVKDLKSGLIWQRYTSGTYPNRTGAQTYCDNLMLGNPGPGYWRLPYIKEISTLLDVSVPHPGPTIDSVAFPNAQDGHYWSSTLDPINPSSLWNANFEYGLSPTVDFASFVRCVRTPVVINPEWTNWDQSMGVYQDATNQTGRYQELHPGVITDSLTNLQWEKIADSNPYNWTAAQAHCDSLVKNGYADWRLPTFIELQSLVDYLIALNSTIPSIDAIAFPNTPTDYFWSSTPLARSANQAWYVSFGDNASFGGFICSQGIGGGCNFVVAGRNGYVRCVRPLSVTQPFDRYTDEVGNTLTNSSTQVKDTITDLIWQRAVSVGYITWQTAQAYCASLGLEGETWRAPTIKELTTLVDVNATNGARLNLTAFPGTLENWYISSTPSSQGSGCGMYLNFATGYIDCVGVGYGAAVRCVRTPVVDNTDWANWDVTTGVYEDQTNQTGRYQDSLSQEVVTDGMTGLQWEKIASSDTYNWTEAQTYCDNLVKSGYADWRLPTHIELQSLVDYTISYTGPNINTAFFPSTLPSYYWASDLVASCTGNGWWVAFGGVGTTSYGGQICNRCFSGCTVAPLQGYTRCVRPLSVNSPADRYRDENDNILTEFSTQVKDLVTNLIWQRNISGAYTWSSTGTSGSAQAYCNQLAIGSWKSGSWRLPTVKELSTLFNTSISEPGPTINVTAFPNTVQGPFWSSTKGLEWIADMAWFVGYSFQFNYGGVGYLGDSGLYAVRCVRSPVIYNPEWANWNATTGVYEDATNQTGRYVEAVTNVITDTLTGLEWQKIASSDIYNWTAAQAYCDNLFQSGFGDWRLPTRVELQSLVDYTTKNTNPGIAPNIFPNTPTDYFWSSTPLAGSSNQTWYVSFGSNAEYAGWICSQGCNLCTAVAFQGYVRCVRPGFTKRVVDRYRDETGNVLTAGSIQVQDLATGLIWQRGTASTYYNFSDAKTYCSNLSLGGQSWRLPKIKELATLQDVDIAYPGPIINTTAFSGTGGGGGYFSSTPSSDSATNAWTVEFDYGSVYRSASVALGFVKCVRTAVGL